MYPYTAITPPSALRAGEWGPDNEPKQKTYALTESSRKRNFVRSGCTIATLSGSLAQSHLCRRHLHNIRTRVLLISSMRCPCRRHVVDPVLLQFVRLRKQVVPLSCGNAVVRFRSLSLQKLLQVIVPASVWPRLSTSGALCVCDPILVAIQLLVASNDGVGMQRRVTPISISVVVELSSKFRCLVLQVVVRRFVWRA